jgi:hypothetical protein
MGQVGETSDGGGHGVEGFYSDYCCALPRGFGRYAAVGGWKTYKGQDSLTIMVFCLIINLSVLSEIK